MDLDYTKDSIRKAINFFIEKDWPSLLAVDIYEPTLSHRIAVYLEGLFPEYYVDCEYNKHLDGDKITSDGMKRI